MEEMEIFAINGHQVKVTEETKNNGHKSDSERIKKHLEIDKIYEVNYTDVHDWCTDVYLIGFDNIRFNGVNFVSVEEQSIEETQQHPDYKRYN